MCKGFGMIVDKDLNGYFIAPNDDGNMSHSEILSDLGLEDNSDIYVLRFVRVQCPDWKISSFEFDEENTLPGWAEENREKIKSVVRKALRRAASAWAEYDEVRDTAWAEYEGVRDTAWDEYEKVRYTAWAEYDKVNGTAWAEYHAVCASAWNRFIKRLSGISGYVGNK
jgi:hypothetical protein